MQLDAGKIGPTDLRGKPWTTSTLATHLKDNGTNGGALVTAIKQIGARLLTAGQPCSFARLKDENIEIIWNDKTERTPAPKAKKRSRIGRWWQRRKMKSGEAHIVSLPAQARQAVALSPVQTARYEQPVLFSFFAQQLSPEEVQQKLYSRVIIASYKNFDDRLRLQDLVGIHVQLPRWPETQGLARLKRLTGIGIKQALKYDPQSEVAVSEGTPAGPWRFDSESGGFVKRV